MPKRDTVRDKAVRDSPLKSGQDRVRIQCSSRDESDDENHQQRSKKYVRLVDRKLTRVILQKETKTCFSPMTSRDL